MHSQPSPRGPHKTHPTGVEPTGWCRWDDDDGEPCDEHATGWMWLDDYGWTPACDEHSTR